MYSSARAESVYKSNKDKSSGFLGKLHASLVENNTQTPDVTGKVVRAILDKEGQGKLMPERISNV